MSLAAFSYCVYQPASSAGIPLHPTLGTPARSVAEIYERFGDLEFSAEFKYDGQRAQVHVENREGRVSVSIFSRHLEDMTNKVSSISASANFNTRSVYL